MTADSALDRQGLLVLIGARLRKKGVAEPDVQDYLLEVAEAPLEELRRVARSHANKTPRRARRARITKKGAPAGAATTGHVWF